MVITKEQCLKLFKEIGFDKAAMDLGVTLGGMDETSNELSWKNVVEAAKEYTDNDRETMTDFVLDVEYYESK